MREILLSYPIENNSPHYIGTTELYLEPLTQIKNGDDYNTYKITVGNHSGTHIDAPKHFVNTGRSIADYSPEELRFKNPIVLDCPKKPYELLEIKDIQGEDLDRCDCLLFRTGFGKFRETDLQKYLTKSPGIAVETVAWIRENHPQIRCLGIDTISMSRYQDAENAKQTHITGFKTNKNYGEPLLFIEDMNLDLEEKLTLNEVMIVPWQIKGVDSAPCTVIGFSDH